MKELKYTLIKDQLQYEHYCNVLETLVYKEDSSLTDEIELLTLLIEKWDSDQHNYEELNPIELLKALMDEHHLKAKDLVNLLNLSKGTVSKILNYQKGLSKNSIRILSQHFKIAQEAFNRPYELKKEGMVISNF